jgi:hypothetical protein
VNCPDESQQPNGLAIEMRDFYAVTDSMPFSDEEPPVQQYRFGHISARWSQLNGLTKDWTDKAVSFLMLTNSGGAVAVLSFMGASDKVREMVGPRIALGCFSLGVICTGILVAKQFHRFERVFTGYRKEAQEYLADRIEWGVLTSNDDNRVKPRPMDYVLGYIPFALFIGGCITGAISLL